MRGTWAQPRAEHYSNFAKLGRARRSEAEAYNSRGREPAPPTTTRPTRDDRTCVEAAPV